MRKMPGISAKTYIGSDVKISSSWFRILAEELIDNGVEFHQPTVLAEIILWFTHHVVELAVAANQCDLLGSLEWWQDFNLEKHMSKLSLNKLLKSSTMCRKLVVSCFHLHKGFLLLTFCSIQDAEHRMSEGEFGLTQLKGHKGCQWRKPNRFAHGWMERGRAR